MEQQTDEKAASLNIFQVIASILAAGIGVQSQAARERDFERGNPKMFIAAGLIFTLGFLVGMIALVQSVIATAS